MDSISGFLGSFQSGGALSSRRALTVERSVMSGCVLISKQIGGGAKWVELS